MTFKFHLQIPIFLTAVALEYQKHENLDCLQRNDLHSLRSNGTTNHENCVEWCNNNNSSCAGFALHKLKNTCYFKSYDCENDLTNTDGTDLYLKRGTSTWI